jgi:AbiTii-like protein
MMLLDDIIQTAVDSNQRLSVLLRKCLLLAYELKNDRLKSWANQELNGYPSSDSLPEYRIIRAGAYGHLLGPLQAEMHNYPIPSVVLEEKLRVFALKVYLRQAVSAYEDAVEREGDVLRFDWPADMVAYYQQRFVDGYALVSAWQAIPKASLVELLDTIRSRTLNMALEIKDELGGVATDLRDISASEGEKIQQTIVNNIYGGTNYFASGESQMTATTTVQTTISVGNRQELDAALLTSGLAESDLQKLTQAVQADGNRKIGSKVTAWIRANAPQVVAGGVKIRTTIGGELLAEYLKQYFGLST